MSAVRLPPRLVALTPGDLRPGRSGHRRLEAAVRAAVGAGLRGVLLREPLLADREALDLACALRRELGPERWLGLHDRAHLARAAQADAVHLSFRSLRPQEVRAWLDPGLGIGLSTHAGDDPEGWEGADYLFHGPVFPVEKPFARPPIGCEGLRAALERTRVPIWAIGGIAPENALQVLATGARGLAVLSRILPRPDPGTAVRAWREALGETELRS